MLVTVFNDKRHIEIFRNYGDIKLSIHTMKLQKKVVKDRIRAEVYFCDQENGSE